MSSPVLVHVGVRASDIERTIRFWRDGLGLRVAATIPPDSPAPRGYDLTDGHHNFRVFQHNGPERPANVTGLLDYLHVGVAVEDLSAAATRLHDMGFHIYWDGVSGGHAIEKFDPANPPSRSFKVEDPDGITVDVTASRDQWPGVGL